MTRCVVHCNADPQVQKLRTHKQITIKQLMGHAPMTKDEVFASKSGKLMNEKKLEREVHESERADEFTMSGSGM
jgi:hypothetical protein